MRIRIPLLARERKKKRVHATAVYKIDTIESLMWFWATTTKNEMKSETSFCACRWEFASGTIINNNPCYSAENIARVLYLQGGKYMYKFWEFFVATSRMSNQTKDEDEKKNCIIVGSFWANKSEPLKRSRKHIFLNYHFAYKWNRLHFGC